MQIDELRTKGKIIQKHSGTPKFLGRVYGGEI